MTFVLSLGVFGVTAFADVTFDGTNYKYKFDFVGYDIYCNSVSIYKESGSYGGYYVKVSDGWMVSQSDGSTFSLWSKYEIENVKNTVGFRIEDKEIVIDGTVNPPVIAPTVKQAVAKIVPDLLEQSKKLLPVGVMLLSTMLGVSLVPRLVRSFL